MTVKEILHDTETKMKKTIEATQREFSIIRTGRASSAILESVKVDYYGTPTPLNQMASVAVPEAQTITIQPWDATALAAVEKALVAANLGMNPSNDGKMIRLTVPALTEERRKQFAKQVHEIAEEHRIAVRNIRHHSNDVLKKLLKEKTISEDEERGGLDDVQKLTNNYIAKIDELSKNKETEIMSV